ncbi:MAG: hypothetical protein HOO67_02805 [Candidatus Peribacteraceae bacterium]|nr:hypothetical protein [Candidatus Peribacteraceae bacterium]
MSGLDMDVGRHAIEEVNHFRTANGRWPLRVDDQLSQWAWDHTRWMVWGGGGFNHPGYGTLGNQTENIFQGRCQNPYDLASHFIHHGDNVHRENFLREDICAQGVAIYTSEYFDRYHLVLTWRARRQ